MPKIDKTGDAAIMPLHKILMKMCGQTGYTPQQAEARRPYISCEDLDYNCVKMAAINMAVHGCFGEAICHDSLCEPDKVRLGYIVNESMWPFPTNVPSIRKEMDPMRFVATRLWAMRGSADRKTLDKEVTENNNQLPENNNQLPENNRQLHENNRQLHENNKLSNKQPVQLELW